MVERVRLLIELTSFSYEGSNPSFSAPKKKRFRLLNRGSLRQKKPKTPLFMRCFGETTGCAGLFIYSFYPPLLAPLRFREAEAEAFI